MLKKILIVDDEEDIISLVKMILEDAGYSVESETDGKDVLQRVAKDHVDLILLDIMMPFLSGWEVLEAMRSQQHTRNIPIALLTARASPLEDNQPYPTITSPSHLKSSSYWF